MFVPMIHVSPDESRQGHSGVHTDKVPERRATSGQNPFVTRCVGEQAGVFIAAIQRLQTSLDEEGYDWVDGLPKL